MIALLRWLIGFIFAAAIITFAVLNRDTVTLTYTPIHDPLEWPMYAIGLLLLAVGYIFGALTIWIGDSKLRRERRRQRKEIKSLNKELNSYKPERGENAIHREEIKSLLPALPDKAQ